MNESNTRGIYTIDYDHEDKAIRINGRYFFTFKKSDEMFYVMHGAYIAEEEEEYEILISSGPGTWRTLSYYSYLDFIRMYGFDPKTRKRVC